MFAHNSQGAKVKLEGIHVEEQDQHKADLLQKKYDEFINFAIKEMASQMITEQKVTLEFMDSSERSYIELLAESEG